MSKAHLGPENQIMFKTFWSLNIAVMFITAYLFPAYLGEVALSLPLSVKIEVCFV